MAIRALVAYAQLANEHQVPPPPTSALTGYFSITAKFMSIMRMRLSTVIMPAIPVLCEQSLARLGAEVTGIDPSPENVAVASAHAQGDPLTRSIRYKAATAEELKARGGCATAGVFVGCC